jgi:hypothetical protein
MSTKGVTYIKINRIDAEGNDNTLSLQALTNIRIKYSDIGVIDYPIYTIAEYPDYYLYQLYQTDITSSTDNNITNYKLLATHSSDNYSLQAGIPAPGVTPSRFIEFPDVISSSLYYNNLDNYTFENTPSHPVTFSFSITDNETPGDVFYYLWSNYKGAVEITPNVGSGNSTTIIFSSSFQTNEIVGISYTSGNSFNTTNASLLVTQSISPTSSLNLVILEPYLTENFELSDCNVLYGNVDSYPFNPLYMDVDYSTNGMIAINTNQIISGSAFRSTVKPYYYSLRRHIRPRYNGSENTDPGAWEFFDVDVTSGIGATPSQYILKGFRPSNFNVGDKIKIFQPGNTFKGEVSIYRITGNNISILQSQIPSLVTLSPLAGIVYLVDNYFENSTTFPLDTFNSDIFEYKYGNTTFPEIPNASALTMGNILEVADQNNVNVLQQGSQYFEAYNKIISDIFIPNTIISDIRQYGDGKQVTLNNLKIITSDFGTPTSPQNAGSATEYWIPTNNSAASVMATASGTTLSINTNQGAYEIELNELNQYTTASSGLIPSHSVVNSITASLNEGNRWFVTIYNELPNPLDRASLSPFIADSNADYSNYSLEGRGVYEIISGSGTDFNLKVEGSSGLPSINIGNGNKGILLWKAEIPSPVQGKYIVVSKPNVNELGPGAIVLPDSNESINQYFNEITTTFGANTKPPTNQSSRGPSSGPSGLSR